LDQRRARTVLALFLSDGTVDLLFREGRAAQVGRFTVPGLEPITLAPLSDAPEGGEMGSCGSGLSVVWSVAADNGRLEAISQIAGIGLNTLGAIWIGQHWATDRSVSLGQSSAALWQYKLEEIRAV
jgi:hypothetical protein